LFFLIGKDEASISPEPQTQSATVRLLAQHEQRTALTIGFKITRAFTLRSLVTWIRHESATKVNWKSHISCVYQHITNRTRLQETEVCGSCLAANLRKKRQILAARTSYSMS